MYKSPMSHNWLDCQPLLLLYFWARTWFDLIDKLLVFQWTVCITERNNKKNNKKLLSDRR